MISWFCRRAALPSRRRRVIHAVIDVQAFERKFRRFMTRHRRGLPPETSRRKLRQRAVSDFVSNLPHTRRVPDARDDARAVQWLRSVRRKLQRTTVSYFVVALVRVLFRHFRFFRRSETAEFCKKHRCLLLAGELGFEPRLTESESFARRCFKGSFFPKRR